MTRFFFGPMYIPLNEILQNLFSILLRYNFFINLAFNLSPGSTIYLWNHVAKKIMSAYNCRKAFDDLNFKQSSDF